MRRIAVGMSMDSFFVTLRSRKQKEAKDFKAVAGQTDTRNYHMASNDGKEHGARTDGQPGCVCEEGENKSFKKP